MRVLVLSHMYPNTVNPLGGIFVQQQVKALAHLGVEVRVVAPVPWVPGFMRGKGKWGGYAGVPAVEAGGGFPVFHPRVLEFPRSLFFEYYSHTYAWGIRDVFTTQIQSGVDVIHAHVAHPDGAAALRFGRHFGIPVVVTIHGQDFAYTLQRSKTCAQSVRETLRQAAAVILVSAKLRDRYGLASWADDLSKYRVIYNGVDLDEVPPPGAEQEAPAQAPPSRAEEPAFDWRRQEAQPAGPAAPKAAQARRILLSVGFLRPDKGHAIVLRALRELLPEFPDLLYRIVGDGEERRTLERLTAELGLSGHVEFLGSLPHPLAMQQMAQCEVFVLPSWREAFGVVYLEAMAHGKPVVGTAGEGIAEILTHEEVGLAVAPRDPQALAQALRRLLRDREGARRMGERGRELVRAQFTWEANAREVLATYQEVAQRWRGAKHGT